MADWGSVLGGLIGPLGPVIGGIVGGPAGAAIGGVVGKAVAEAVGVDPSPGALLGADREAVEAAAAKVASDPEILAKVVAIANAETEQIEAMLADVQDARRADAMRLEAGSATSWTPTVLSILALAGFALVTFTGLSIKMDATAKEVFLFLAGQWSGFAAMGFAFFFGSSPSSKHKDTIIGEALKRAVK